MAREPKQNEVEPSEDKTGLILPDQILPPNLFILPTNVAAIYPTLMAPIVVSDPRFIATVEEAIKRQRIIGLLLVRNGSISEKTRFADLYNAGVAVKILKRLKMPDGTIHILVHSMKRFTASLALSEDPHIVVEARYHDDILIRDDELDALSRTALSYVKKLSETSPFFNDEIKLAMLNAPNPGVVSDLIAFALSLSKEAAQRQIETLDVRQRFENLLLHLKKEQDLAELQQRIQEGVAGRVDKMQREFFLREQLKTIRKELGMEEDGKEKSARELKEKIETIGMPEAAKKAALEELAKLETLSEQSPEFNVTRTYLETMTSLPWSVETKDILDIEHAEKILNADHYGMEKVKERILEFLAVRQLKAAKKNNETEKKGSILCLVGPPGVGKTSVGKSIARAMNRKFYRFSLGGMRDEAEIKGHRRTYVGALPGKVIQAMRRVESRNPVLILDEIDKLGVSFQGDPASALLEVLDPEQNSTFLDHYLDVNFDLSNVLFIATANSISTIPAPLLDRMEIIELPGYTIEEKEKIARQYVIPKVLKEHGLSESEVRISKLALRKILSDYAREPGLRTLQQLVARIARKAATQIVKNNPLNGRIETIGIEADNIKTWLGPKRYINELKERITLPGVVVGLAWTSHGGDILFIEATQVPGTGSLKLTGQLGEVMSESANIAWTYIRGKLGREGKVTYDEFKKMDYHLHIPAGAVPKDGPSAGVTLASALYSLLSGKVSRSDIAMTGELSLVGKVLPVGGIKEKILAAKRAGITQVILPEGNMKDVEDVPSYALKGMRLHYVKHVDEVFKLAFESTRVRAPKKETPVRKHVLKKRKASSRPASLIN